MKKSKLFLTGIPALALVFGFVACGSSPERVGEGKFFKAHYDYADPSIPVEEQAVLINLAGYESIIGTIDGEKAVKGFGMINAPRTSLNAGDFTVLPPGIHSFTIYYYEYTYGLAGTSSSSEATVPVTAELLPGHYYFLHGGQVSGNRVSFSIDDLEDHKTVQVHAGYTKYSREEVSTEAVIDGIQAVLARTKK